MKKQTYSKKLAFKNVSWERISTNFVERESSRAFLWASKMIVLEIPFEFYRVLDFASSATI